MKALLILVVPLLFISCGKKDGNNLEEVTQRELAVENDNLNRRAALLERDLARKQLFFSALEGTYEGSFSAGEKVFKTRVTLIPSLPPYTSNRVRTLEEVTADLNNLNFSIQTTSWNATGTAVAAGCIFGQVKPDYDNGQVTAAVDTCSNVYKINIYDSNEATTSDFPAKTSDVAINGQNLAKKIFSKEILKVNEIYVVIQPTLLAKTFIAILKRVE